MKTWKLSSFDPFSLGMVIKGAWIYKELPEVSVLQASLDAVLQPYPQLLGRYDAKLKSVIWSGHEESIRLVELDCKEHSVSEDMYTLVPKFNTDKFKNGKSQALEAYRITLADGAAIVLQGAHALMDGRTFYTVAGDWGKLTSGAPVEVMTVNQDELTRMRTESGAGTNSTLCQYAVSKLLEKFQAKEKFTLIEVADLRGRVGGVPENFFGNFSQAVVIGEFDRDATAADIQKAASAVLDDKKALSENVQLSVCSSSYGLPYFMFDPSDMNSRDPKLFYVNNQLKLKACEVNFGTGMPLRAQQAMLPDMIKFWQPKYGGPVQIIYGGYAAKIMGRIENQR